MTAFDYIVVGAGSAGAALAHRLTEDPSVRLLLLEAGPSHRNWRIDMPTALARAIRGDRFNWRYSTEPEPHLGGRIVEHPRGRVLGGSSAINGMMYVRGHARDYDRWAQAGCAGWSYADVLPYFKRAERREGGGDAWRGGEGPLTVARARGANPLYDAFVEAGVEAGYARTEDVNGRRQEGFGRIDRTIGPDGRRASVARCYLDPVRGRANLRIETGALATRILLRDGAAIGVRYEAGGRTHEARAGREVLLAGGAIASPQLLMLSGIGPADRLRAHGVEVAQDLPGVGANLQDHPSFTFMQACLQPVSLHSALSPLGRLAIGLRWFLLRDGLGATNHYEAGAFVRTRAGLEHPDLQLTFLPLGLGGGEAQAEVSIGRHAFSVHGDLMRPASRGELALRSADPRERPRLVFNYLAAPEDAAAMVRGVRLVREIVAQPALAPFAGEELAPGADAVDDAAIEAWLRASIGTAYHPVGTCRMGAAGDPMAVVDPELRVRGVARLRVIDASVMPDLVSGNTNAPTIMIGEKGADLVAGRAPLPRDEAEPEIHSQWETEQR